MIALSKISYNITRRQPGGKISLSLPYYSKLSCWSRFENRLIRDFIKIGISQILRKIFRQFPRDSLFPIWTILALISRRHCVSIVVNRVSNRWLRPRSKIEISRIFRLIPGVLINLNRKLPVTVILRKSFSLIIPWEWSTKLW